MHCSDVLSLLNCFPDTILLASSRCEFVTRCELHFTLIGSTIHYFHHVNLRCIIISIASFPSQTNWKYDPLLRAPDK